MGHWGSRPSNARQNNWSWSKAKENNYLLIWVSWKYWRELCCSYLEQFLKSNQGSIWTTTTPQRYSKNAPKMQSVPVLPDSLNKNPYWLSHRTLKTGHDREKIPAGCTKWSWTPFIGCIFRPRDGPFAVHYYPPGRHPMTRQTPGARVWVSPHLWMGRCALQKATCCGATGKAVGTRPARRTPEGQLLMSS